MPVKLQWILCFAKVQKEEQKQDEFADLIKFLESEVLPYWVVRKQKMLTEAQYTWIQKVYHVFHEVLILQKVILLC